jgi:hypothetical protein
MKNSAWLDWRRIAAVVAVGCIAGASVGQSLADFVIPAASDTPEQVRAVSDPGSVTETHDEALGIPVVSAPKIQDAVNAVSKNLIDTGDGVKAISTSAGTGFVATGSVTYAATSKNPDLAVIEQRWASIQAFLNAKRALADYLEGMSIAGKRTLVSDVITAMNDEFTANNASKSAEEQVNEMISAMLRGVVIYDYHDDPENGRVTVSVVVTPRTVGAVRSTDVAKVTAESLQSGLQHVLTEIKSGVVPPVGGRTIAIPETGEFVWVGFGATTIPSSSSPDLAADLENSSIAMARASARNALLAIISGEQYEAQFDGSNRFRKQQAEFDALLSESGDESVQKKEVAEFQRAADTAMREAVGEVTAGRLPPGVQTKTYRMEGSPWIYSVAIFSVSNTGAASALAESMRKNSPLGAVSEQAKTVGFQTNPDGTIKRGPDGKPMLKSLGSGRVTSDKDL